MTITIVHFEEPKKIIPGEVGEQITTTDIFMNDVADDLLAIGQGIIDFLQMKGKRTDEEYQKILLDTYSKCATLTIDIRKF